MAQSFTSPDRTFHVAEFALEDVGARGYASVPVYVHGYWSDVITLYIKRECDWRPDAVPTWTFEVTHSSGGRDDKAVPDSLEAERNFGNALLNVTQLARGLRADSQEVLEAAYQVEMAARREQEARDKAAKEAAIEADEPVGLPRAVALLATLDAQVRTAKTYDGRSVECRLLPRGLPNADPRFLSTLRVEFRPNTNLTLFYVGGQRMARRAAESKVAEFSVRTLAQPVSAQNPLAQ